MITITMKIVILMEEIVVGMMFQLDCALIQIPFILGCKNAVEEIFWYRYSCMYHQIFIRNDISEIYQIQI